METKVEALEGNRAKVIVTIDEKTVTDRIKKQYKQVANQYNFPGFRRGKAPRPVIDNMLGKEYVQVVVTDDLMNETYPVAIDESGLFPVGQPDFGEETVHPVQDKQAYTYEFQINTMPTFELSSYDPVEIEMPPESATDEQIDAEIDALLDHYVDIVPAPANTKVKEDKYVEMKITATDDNGDEIESLTTESTQYGLESGLYPKSFDEQILGMKKGETKQFTIDMPSELYAMTATLAGKTSQINFDVEILTVLKKKVPELTDEWVQNKIGVETVDELRDELRDEIDAQNKAIFPRLKEGRVLNALQERLQGDVPENIVAEEESTLLQDFFNQLQRQGVTLDVYLQQQGITSDQFRADIKEQAEEVARQDVALDAYAAHAEMTATDEDVLEEFEKAGANDPKALMEEWRKNGQLYRIRQGILREKAANELVEGAIVTEEKPEEKAKKSAKHAAKPEAKAEDAEAEESEAQE